MSTEPTDAQVDAALRTFYGVKHKKAIFAEPDPSRMREALRVALSMVGMVEIEYAYKALGSDPVVASWDWCRTMHERWGDKILQRIKAGDWEEVSL